MATQTYLYPNSITHWLRSAGIIYYLSGDSGSVDDLSVFELPSEWMDVSGTRYLSAVEVHSDGSLGVRVSDDGSYNSGTGDDFTSDFEQNCQFVITHGPHELTINSLGSDSTEPYAWTPDADGAVYSNPDDSDDGATGSSAVTAFYSAVTSRTNGMQIRVSPTQGVNLAGDIEAVPTLSGSIKAFFDISGDIAIVPTLDGEVGGFVDLSGDIGVATTLGGEVGGDVNLSGDIDADTTVSGAPEVLTPANLSGDIDTDTTIDGEVQALPPTNLAGDIGIDTILAGDIGAFFLLSGDIDIVPTLDGEVKKLVDLSGDIDADIAVNGSPEVLVPVNLSGDIDIVPAFDGIVEGFRAVVDNQFLFSLSPQHAVTDEALTGGDALKVFLQVQDSGNLALTLGPHQVARDLILQVPTISSDDSDLIGSSDVTIRLNNAGGQFSDDDEFIGKQAQLWGFSNGQKRLVVSGHISAQVVTVTDITLTISDIPIEAVEEVLPKRTITEDDFPTSQNIGGKVPVVFGRALRHRCPNISIGYETTLSSGASSGDDELTLDSVIGIAGGDRLAIGLGTNQLENKKVESVNVSTNTVTLTSNLSNSHSSGDVVTNYDNVYDYLLGEGGYSENSAINFDNVDRVYHDERALPEIYSDSSGTISGSGEKTLTLEGRFTRPLDNWYENFVIDFYSGSNLQASFLVTDYDTNDNQITFSKDSSASVSYDNYRLREYRFFDGSQDYPYSGYAFIRFAVKYTGEIRADVKGFSRTNPFDFLETVFKDNVWGAGAGDFSFTTADRSAMNDYKIEGVIAQDIAIAQLVEEVAKLRPLKLSNPRGATMVELLGTVQTTLSAGVSSGATSLSLASVADIYPGSSLLVGVGTNNEEEVVVSAVSGVMATVEALTNSHSSGAVVTKFRPIDTDVGGFIDSPVVRALPISERSKKVTVRYRPDHGTGELLNIDTVGDVDFSLGNIGTERIIELPFVYEKETADRVLYREGKLAEGQKEILECAVDITPLIDSSGGLKIGGIVSVADDTVTTGGGYWEVLGIEELLDTSYNLSLAPYVFVDYNRAVEDDEDPFDPDLDYSQAYPEPVSSLMLETSQKISSTGEESIFITSSWTKPEENYSGAHVYYKETSATTEAYEYAGIALEELQFQVPKANTGYTVRVFSIDAEGILLGEPAEATITSQRDTTAPSVPSTPRITGSLRTMDIVIQGGYTKPSDFETFEYELDPAETDKTDSNGHIRSVDPQISLTLAGTDTSTTYRARVRAIDKSGNESNWSDWSNNFTPENAETDIDFDGEFETFLTSLDDSNIYLVTDADDNITGLRLRDVDGSVINDASIPGSAITDTSISGAKIMTGAIETNLIAANAVTAETADINDLAAGIATVIELNADRINAGELHADFISGDVKNARVLWYSTNANGKQMRHSDSGSGTSYGLADDISNYESLEFIVEWATNQSSTNWNWDSGFIPVNHISSSNPGNTDDNCVSIQGWENNRARFNVWGSGTTIFCRSRSGGDDNPIRVYQILGIRGPRGAGDSDPGESTTPGDSLPSLTNPGTQNWTVSDSESVTVSVSGGDAPLSYSWSGTVPPGLSFPANSRTLSGTPTTAGTYSVTLTVTDDDNDSDSVTFSIRVEASSSNLSLPSISNQTATVGTSFSLTHNAATGGSSPYTYSASGTGRGISYSAATRTFSGNPTSAGTLNITVTVTDSDSNTDTESFTITISAASTTPSAPTGLTATVSALGFAFSSLDSIGWDASSGATSYEYTITTVGDDVTGTTTSTSVSLSNVTVVVALDTLSVRACAGTDCSSYTTETIGDIL